MPGCRCYDLIFFLRHDIMVNSPMDIDMEAPQKSFARSARQSKGKSRQPSIAPASAAPKTPRTVLLEDANTQTRRILKVRRRIGDVDVDYKPTSPTAIGMKRKLFGSPTDSPLSPGLGGARAKQRRLAHTPPVASRKSSAPATGRKSRGKRSMNRPSAPGVPRRSTISTASSGFHPSLETMTVRQLKNLLTSAGVDTADCIEKQELVDKANRLGLTVPVNGRPSVSAKSTPVMEPVTIPAPTLGNAGKRHSRKQSGGKVSATALMEIARIEEVVSKSSATSFDILGIAKLGASEASIKSRSKQLFRHVHPDKVHDESIKQRAQNVFQLITQAVDEALKIAAASSTSGPKEVPKPPVGIKYTVERAGTVVLLRWKPDKSAESFRVFALIPGQFRSSIDQGTVANMTGDNGELEYAISAQSRAGNDELFRRGKFEVAVTALNAAGESPSMTIGIDLNRPSSLGGLKRHHTIC